MTEKSALPATLEWNELDDRAVDTVRVLAMDAVQKVGNGHPGTAMSLAPAAYLLFQKVMRHNPADPHWPGRDRFVLSCGHSSLTLYIQLYLGGWGLELDDLKALRTWGSKTPGHPEHGHTAGVETTTGPLGQGIGNAVGMAMAARRERGMLDPNAAEGASPFDHQIYAICSDGDIEEGVSAEASAIAGVQELGNLTVIYDANRISIEDDTDIALGEDVGARYEAYGWHVQTVDWTHDETQLRRGRPGALRRDPQGPAGHRPAQLHRPAHDHRLARARPCRTPARATAPPSARRRSPPPRRSSASTPSRPSRCRPTSSSTPARRSPAARPPRPRGTRTSPTGRRSRPPTGPSSTGCRPARSPTAGPTRCPSSTPTRRASPPASPPARPSTRIAPALPELWGGSADLAGSNNTTIEGVPSFLPKDRSTKMFSGDPLAGRVLHFGIREHGMGAIMNGIAVHGGTRVFGGTFLTFSDYMRPSVRLAALMQLPVTYVWTHDSIGLGEDGPTHQPIEHLAALRAIPGLDVVRPADANETVAAWKTVLEHNDRPAGLCLSRQNVPTFPRGEDGLRRHEQRPPRRLRPARHRRASPTSSSSAPAPRCSSPSRRASSSPPTASPRASSRCRAASGTTPRTTSYRETVIPPLVKARVSVEAGIAHGLARGRRRPRPHRVDRALRRVAPTTSGSTASSASPRRPSPRRPATASPSATA